MSRIDYFLVDQETGAYTNSAKIEEITQPFDHSQITLEIDFDKVMREPGYWKFNNSHLENPTYIKLIKLRLVELAHQNQLDLDHPKTEHEMIGMTPEELQLNPTMLNPQELMEQLHFMLKATTISFSIKEHRKRKAELSRVGKRVDSLNNDLINPTNTVEENEDIREEL